MSSHKKYPFYGIGAQSKIIVYFIKPSCGFTIEPGFNTKYKRRTYEISGTYGESWNMKCFIKIVNPNRIKKLERKRKLLSLL